jgi:hypothetical protein
MNESTNNKEMFNIVQIFLSSPFLQLLPGAKLLNDVSRNKFQSSNPKKEPKAIV